MSNPYQNLIDRLRDLAEDMEGIVTPGDLREAADVIESLTKKLADGPVAYRRWNHKNSFFNIYYMSIHDRSNSPLPDGWIEQPLYYIPIPEVK